MTFTLTTALRTIDPNGMWCEDCTTYGDACYDCAVTVEMMED